MSFTVKVTQTKDKTEKRQEWVRVSDSGNPQGGGSVYAYSPWRDVIVACSIDLYEQTVEELDIAALIRAVNGMKE